MPEHVSILQLVGVVGLVLVTAAWVILLRHTLRHSRSEAAARRSGRPLRPLRALPQQRQAGPPMESVELTPAEQDAFAGLIRRLDDR
ncbi:hypothetical protein [Streptomyces olivochromogenes]|uniref:hypothetical protein n=1 Tax=Streptomyces olivochromogenes TaxID=1963 RepID=UPI001F259583|nr:hypothetical protein [Streptomyces olivochromogenes]MCF3136157.1 hypothetical protein [Streptomyces olivochromogenes]